MGARDSLNAIWQLLQQATAGLKDSLLLLLVPDALPSFEAGNPLADRAAAFHRDYQRAQARHVFTGHNSLIAVGDIHGRADLLQNLFHHIDSLPGSDRITEIYLGDYVDRGPQSREVISMLLERQSRGRTLIFLRGNHETMFSYALEEDAELLAWLDYGGRSTLNSYGVNTQNAFADPGAVRAALNKAVPPSHRAFLQNLVNYHEENEYLFVHAGVRPGVSLDDQTPEDLTTIREPFLSCEDDYGMTVVHGHTPKKLPVFRDNRIGLDTGAFHTSLLSALKLNRDSLELIQISVEGSRPVEAGIARTGI